MMTGWISLHRSIEEHWTFKEKRKFSKFEAWIDILLMVNHKDKKIVLGNELIVVKRGQKITSIRQLCERWHWSNNKVKNFLKMLEEDGMLNVKSDAKKTLLTVVKYDVYQSQNLEMRRESDAKATRMHTNNNDNNVNNENKENKDNKRQSVFSFYQENGFGVLRPYIADQISGWLDDFENDGEEIVIAAMQEAIKNNVLTWNYVNGILKHWTKDKVKSIEDIQTLINQHKKQKDEFDNSQYRDLF
ncbi:DnaD domain protein [Staphylococcus pseudintermedius]|uniref:DnaD domain-containing protein n=1 Tax=Staphylococcus pseudintermedius TaxID=283734 RepID=UPI002884FC97|nr:DnaD domain protein [Staphylococcus pseudintermedius]EJL7989673.1 DnaD domain protein [Staphylococcus pseudintermedius]MDT0902742.1 DnaD domain protein [Staphylococcus pseudintermedius]HCA7835469.1 DnaD domain protein [Staphylococcus pseudintermedius]HCT0548802.1 DnaD domain protein [Staphylococcus pseudintermedius]HDK5708501.1 DnaD domain protein [Staphylococcus pseudintermedius]